MLVSFVLFLTCLALTRGARDLHEFCCFWAGNNECHASPLFMRTTCRKSCGTANCKAQNPLFCHVKVNIDGCPYNIYGRKRYGYVDIMSRFRVVPDQEKLVIDQANDEPSLNIERDEPGRSSLFLRVADLPSSSGFREEESRSERLASAEQTSEPNDQHFTQSDDQVSSDDSHIIKTWPSEEPTGNQVLRFGAPSGFSIDEYFNSQFAPQESTRIRQQLVQKLKTRKLKSTDDMSGVLCNEPKKCWVEIAKCRQEDILNLEREKYEKRNICFSLFADYVINQKQAQILEALYMIQCLNNYYPATCLEEDEDITVNHTLEEVMPLLSVAFPSVSCPENRKRSETVICQCANSLICDKCMKEEMAKRKKIKKMLNAVNSLFLKMKNDCPDYQFFRVNNR